VLAYAQIDSLDLGFLTISESKSAATDPIGLREDSLAASLVPKVPGGPVFFLSASRRDVTFFLDGRVSLLRLATVDARIVFRAGLISIHALVEIVGVQASAIVEASYADFSSANFEFRFQLDCKGLLRKLQAVTDAIDQAVAQLRSTVANARAALAEAQDQVDSLREQIRHFDQKIQACRQAVRDASWWTRAFVVIAKGAEIAAYELAKAGIHTAMGVATAALKVADAAVAGFGGLGEAVLKVVDSAIRAATSLFFLKTVELSARANTAAVQLSAGISFVFLDREYSYSTRFKAGLLDGLEKDIATNILGQLDPDLQLLRQGKPLPPRVSMKAIGPRAVEAVEIPDIKGGDNAIRCATKVMVGIQRRYFEKFGEELPELRALNASFVSTLYSAESALDLANRTALVGELRDLPQAVRSLDPARGTDAVGTALGDALKNFDEASRKHAAVQKAADEASRARSEIERVMAEPVPPSSAFTRSTDPEVLKQRLADLLAEFREEILEIYPHDEDTDYIDLSREPKLQEICDDTLKSVGRSPAPLRMAPLAKLSTARRPYRPRL
jgi:ABC-type transporter Mla subunit MlaD